jgi:hypothetical protein
MSTVDSDLKNSTELSTPSFIKSKTTQSSNVVPYPQAVPERKNTTTIQPMINAAAIRIRILAFFERDISNFRLAIYE